MNPGSKSFSYTVRELMIAGLIVLTPAMLAAANSGQRRFSAPDDAIHALIHASESNDTAALLHIFGSEGKRIAESGDPAQDAADREEFARLARERLQVVHDSANPDRVTFWIA